MFGLPSDTNIDFVIGCELQQVAFGAFQLLLHFSHKVSLSVEGRLELTAPGQSKSWAWEPEQSSEVAKLSSLIGAMVIKYEIPGDGRLVLYFDNGYTVTACDSNADHESYQLIGDGKTLVV